MEALRFRLRVFLIVFITIMVLGSLGFMLIEGLSLADAFYFSIVTIATVGYGDIHPATQAGKILAIILIITGVGTFLGVIASATDMLLNKREQRIRMEKLNMVIGSFFSEVGTQLLTLFSDLDPNLENIRSELIVTRDWSEENFCAVGKRLKAYDYSVKIDRMHIDRLRECLVKKRDFLLRLLENPNLLEHEAFTDVLQAVFHLTEELAAREDTRQLPPTDYAHIAADVKRVYVLLIHQWVDYMKYLKNNYPYLFSLAARKNPFDQSASVVVR